MCGCAEKRGYLRLPAVICDEMWAQWSRTQIIETPGAVVLIERVCR